MESIPDHRRHGPADLDFPPPGGPWKPLVLNGRLVGWGEEGGLALARRSAELGEQLADLMLVNDLDLTYAKIRLDERSLATAIDRTSMLLSPWLCGVQVFPSSSDL